MALRLRNPNTDSIRLDGGDLTTRSLIGKLVLRLKAVYGREDVIPEEVGFWVTWKNTTKRSKWGGPYSASLQRNSKKGSRKHL